MLECSMELLTLPLRFVHLSITYLEFSDRGWFYSTEASLLEVWIRQDRVPGISDPVAHRKSRDTTSRFMIVLSAASLCGLSIF
jgi:hypothetical protein